MKTYHRIVQRPKQAVIVIHADQLMRSIDRKAYTQSQAMGDDMPDHTKALVADIAQEANAPEVAELVNAAVTSLARMLAAYNKTTACDLEVADNDDDTTLHDYTLRLTLPATWQRGATQAIERLALQYVANTVMRDWTAVTAPQLAQTYADRMEQARQHIATLAQGRTDTPRIHPGPI